MSLGWWFGRREVDAFARSESGNVAMLWAFMGAVLVGLIGLTVDFTRAQAIRAQLQNAADGAVLVAERSSNLDMEVREARARAFFDAEAGDLATQVDDIDFDVEELDAGGHRVTASFAMPLSLARLIRNEDWRVAVSSEAEASASPPIEVALVLDNTGSMANDMDDLREAAQDLVESLLEIDGDSVSIALVPFVAQVNIGNNATTMQWMDTAGNAPYNGELFEDRQIAWRNSTSSGTNCATLNNTASYKMPYSGYPGPYRLVWVKQGSSCRAFTPDSINYFTLFNLMPGAPWKGCVEARPEPYDIQDDAPTTDATRFVPFFWVDTGGAAGANNSNSSSNQNYRSYNSYLTDTRGNLSSTINGQTVTMTNGADNSPTAAELRRANWFNVFKYRNDTGSNVSFDTTPSDTRGPNRGCPTPITPLTNDLDTLTDAVSDMEHWFGGGTNQAEGLAWGWRVLSPTAPFTEGAEYGETRKVIVLMSDGENTNVGEDAVWLTDYSAYNHRGLWSDYDDGNFLDDLFGLIGGILHGILPSQYRKDIDDEDDFVDYINEREAALCENIKDEDVEIYTIIFRETDEETEQIMRDCASEDVPGSPVHFYRADNAEELNDAFDAIGTGIGQLRLTH